MDTARYYLALVLMVAFPPALAGWFVIHPLAAFWRRRGPTATYLVVVAVAVSLGVALYRLRKPLLQTDFGFSWVSTTIGLLSLVCAVSLELQYRRHLSVSTLLGLPELSTKRESKLLTEGIYSKIRHPRYVGILFEILAFAFFVNYLATYVVAATSVLMLYLIVLLEERELVDRFGPEYERYMQQVPRFVPRLRPPRA